VERSTGQTAEPKRIELADRVDTVPAMTNARAWKIFAGIIISWLLVASAVVLFAVALADVGVKPLPGRFLDFLDPWGNRIEIVAYDNIQFSKAPNVLRGMGLAPLSKNAKAIKELTDKGMAPS
jgi:hypothetical protein